MLKVAVVDDSVEIQQTLARLLSSLQEVEITGFADDVQGALGMIERTAPDVVLLDIALRGGDRGIDVLRAVKRRWPDIQVVTLSNFTWQAMREGFLGAGASAYFDKANEFLRARSWIGELARRRSVHSDGPG